MSAQTSQGVAARTVAMEAAPDRKKPGLLDRIADHLRRYWQLWILSAPALFFVGLFSYVPMWGIQLAFREFDPTKGLTGGKFVGFKYFLEFFHNPLFGEIMTNTIRISLWTLVMGFIFPIILALLINQIGSKKNQGFRANDYLHATFHLRGGHRLHAQHLPDSWYRHSRSLLR